MATVLSTLYPPLVNDFMPAFLASGDATVHFSISAYNAGNAINRLHVSLVYQYTNIKAIQSKNLSNEQNIKIINNVWIVEMNDARYISYNSLTNIYTLTIPQSILKTRPFSTDGYYKLQLRFDQSDAEIKDSYLIDNRNKFSEWSSVCLLKAIPDVKIALTSFDLDNGVVNIPTFNAGVIPISGEVIFENNLTGTKAETLRSYEITLFNIDDPEDILDSSGVIYTADQVDLNRIYWLAGAEQATPDKQYALSITITTKNQYVESKVYSFNIFNYDTTPFNVTWKFFRAELDQYNITTNGKIITEEDGIVQCTITTNSLPPGYLYIKRASSLDNFKKWELISCTKHKGGIINQTFSDATVGSLIKYQYSAQYQLTTEIFTTVAKSTDIVYPDFYDMLLSRGNKQLAIRYKGSISNLKPVVNRQKIDTLGSKYPKFAENAQMNYKQFSINGLIDAESDFNRKFLDDRNYYNEMDSYNTEMNGKYEIRNDTIADGEYAYTGTTDLRKINTHQNTVHDIYPKDNWWWEREFREEAIKWLNDGEPKLFRSMPEGNMTVMLTDISLTPEQTIGRRLYNFSATMYEIEDGYSLETLASLGIVSIKNEKEEQNIAADDGDVIEIVTKSTIGQMSSQELRINPDLNYATVVNRQFTASMDGNSCGLKGFDYNHINIGDLYKYIIYDKDSFLGKKYEILPNSIVLTDLQIEFESKPTWWRFSGNEIYAIDNDNPSVNEINTTKALGYKIQLTLDSKDGNNKIVTVFVNEKGFYQIPNNLKIVELRVYGNAIATINYKINYDITYNTSTIPTSARSQGDIVGQLSGMWLPNTHIAGTIQDKHKWNNTYQGKVISQESLGKWNALGLEVTPYTTFVLKSVDEDYYTYVVGRTGVYNLANDFDLEDLYFMGRRMVLVDKDIVNNITWNQLVALDMTATIDSIKGNTLLSNNKLLNVNIAGIGSKNSNNSILDRCFIDISTYFPEGMKAIGNTYDELTKNEATIRIGSRAHETGDEENNNVITDGITTYYKLATPITIEFESPLDMYYSTKNGNIEFLIMDDTNSESQTAPVPMTITYTANVPPTSAIYKTMTGKKINISNKSDYIYDTNKPLDTLTIYGKSMQNEIPTPDNSASIEVIDGYNLIRNAYTITSSEMALTRSTIPSTGMIKLKPTTSAAYAKFKIDYLDYEQYGTGDYTISFDAMLADDETTYTSSNLMVYVGFNAPSRLSSVFSSSYDRYTPAQTVASDTVKPLSATKWQHYTVTITAPTNMTSGKTTALAAGNYLTVQLGASGSKKPVLVKRVKLEKGNTSNNYIGINYGSTIKEINLHGNFLASLPDGTRDELTIDSTGAVTLIKRVGFTHIDENNSFYIMSNVIYTAISNGKKNVEYQNSVCYSDKLTNAPILNSQFSNYTNIAKVNRITSNDTRMACWFRFGGTESSVNDYKATLASIGGFDLYYTLDEVQTIDLGYIDMPPLTDGDIVYVTASSIPSIAIKQKILQKTYSDNLATISKTVEENVLTTFNQSITIPNGHKYIKIINGTKTLNTSNGTSFNIVSSTDQVFDLTLMFGEGNEPGTISEFEVLYPPSNYSYEPGKIVNINSNKTFSLNEWEYVLDSSATLPENSFGYTWDELVKNEMNGINTAIQTEEHLGQEDSNRLWDNNLTYDNNSQILLPEYNTVYGIYDENNDLTYKLHYIDGGWYDIKFLDSSCSIALAKVPVHGMVNYKGTITQQTFDS